MSELSGVELIAAERQRQIDAEGWTPEHDAKHMAGELISASHAYANAALCVYAPSNPQAAASTHYAPGWAYWPWEPEAFKAEFSREGAIRSLVKAGALIAAEIDRLETYVAAVRSAPNYNAAYHEPMLRQQAENAQLDWDEAKAVADSVWAATERRGREAAAPELIQGYCGNCGKETNELPCPHCSARVAQGDE